MEISFPDAERRQLYCSGRQLREHFGHTLADVVCCRLQFLECAPSLGRVPAGLPTRLRSEATPGRYSVAVGATRKLVFEALPSAAEPLDDVRSILVHGVEQSDEFEEVR